MKKIMFSSVLLMLTLITFAGKKVRVGLSIDNILTDRWVVEVKIIEDGIRARGGEVFVKTALGRYAHQQEQVQELIHTHKIDVLILVPVDKVKSASLVRYAQEEGVRVITYSRSVEGVKANAMISFAPKEIGKKQAHYVAGKTKIGNVILLGGPLSDFNTLQIEAGQKEVFKNSPEIILHTTNVSSWSKMKAYKEMQRLHESGLDSVEAIITGNDLLAQGVIEYLEEHHIKGVIVVGLDAELGACRRITEGKQAMTIYLDIHKSANCAVAVAMNLGLKHPHHTVHLQGIKKEYIDGVETYLVSSTVISEENLAEKIDELHIYTHREVFGN